MSSCYTSLDTTLKDATLLLSDASMFKNAIKTLLLHKQIQYAHRIGLPCVDVMIKRARSVHVRGREEIVMRDQAIATLLHAKSKILARSSPSTVPQLFNELEWLT